jgi:hypothetical protein
MGVEMQMKKSEIQKILRDRVATVTFTKTDGTQRVMKCTLKESSIPVAHQPKGESTRKENDNVLAVFDVEKEGWRSFAMDSIINVQ